MYPYRSDHWGYFCVWRRFSKQETKCANRCGPCAQLPLGPARGCVHATGAPRGGQGSAPASVLLAAGRPRTWAEGQHAPSLLGNVGQTVRASYKSYRRWEVIWLGAKDASYLICCSMVVFIYLFIYLWGDRSHIPGYINSTVLLLLLLKWVAVGIMQIPQR